MGKPLAIDVVRLAARLTQEKSPIPYSKWDCQELIEECVRQCGGNMDYRGSNHMYREACAEIYTLKEAQSQGLLEPGWLLFIVEPVSASTPAQYRGDGLGDASHVGMYTDQTVEGVRVEVAHSSASRGQVAASTLKNAWTHCGPAKCIDYSGKSGAASDVGGQEVSAVPYAEVIPDTLRLRKSMDTSGSSNVIVQMKKGDRLVAPVYQIDGKGRLWAYGALEGSIHRGYAMVADGKEAFLHVHDAEKGDATEAPSSGEGGTYSFTISGLTAEQAMALLSEMMGRGYAVSSAREVV